MKSFILLLCLILMISTFVSAINTSNSTQNLTNITSNLTNITSNLTPNLTLNLTSNLTTNLTTNLNFINTTGITPEEFYGNVTYSDGSPVEKGSKITAKDETGKLVGIFIMTKDGVYGDEYKSSPRLLVYAQSNNDISFYVNNITSTGRIMKFNSASIRKVDIIISSMTKPTPVPTPVPTFIPTPIETTIMTTIPTPIPTTIMTTIPTPIPTTIKPTALLTKSPDTATPKFLGVLLISIAICIVGALITYYILTKKMKRDDEEEINL